MVRPLFKVYRSTPPTAPGYHRGHRWSAGPSPHAPWTRPDGSAPYIPDCVLIALIVGSLLLLSVLLPALRHMHLLSPDKLLGPAAFWAA